VLIRRIRADLCALPASGAKPARAERELQRWPYQPAPIGYRLSAIGYEQPSAIRG